MIQIRSATVDDTEAWLGMREALWPDGDAASHPGEIEQYFAGALRNVLEVLLALDEKDTAIGFAELSIRNCAEDCVTDRVAYLEGWNVTQEARRRGVGRALVAAAIEWGRRQGCTEFASDTTLDNVISAAAHLALGFIETARLRCFRRVIDMDEGPT